MKLDDIPEEKPFRVDHGHTPVVIIRNGSSVKAFHDICPHAYWRLSDGEYRDGVLECPGHAWEFSTQTGECTTVPGYCLTRLTAVVDGEHVEIVWDETDLADSIKLGIRR
jgi:nitrite reductase/ring-hydroxylating ferredoxin subunit